MVNPYHFYVRRNILASAIVKHYDIADISVSCKLIGAQHYVNITLISLNLLGIQLLLEMRIPNLQNVVCIL